MSKISYSSLKLKTNTEVKTFNFNGHEIEVLKYLPIEDKYDLLMITLQKAEEDGIYNPLRLELYFHMNLIYMYTNLTFTAKQKENESKLYDTLKSQGFITMFLNILPQEEYEFLFDLISEMVETFMKYKNTAGAVLQSIIQDLPKNAEAAAQIVDSFDKEKFAEVVNFAKAANGNKLMGQE